MSAGPSPENIMEALNESGYLMEQKSRDGPRKAGLSRADEFPFRGCRRGQIARDGRTRDQNDRAQRRAQALLRFRDHRWVQEHQQSLRVRRQAQHCCEWKLRAWRVRVLHTMYEARRLLGKGSSNVQLTEPFHHLGFLRVHYAYQRPEKAVQFCRIDRTEVDGMQIMPGCMMRSFPNGKGCQLASERGTEAAAGQRMALSVVLRPARGGERRYLLGPFDAGNTSARGSPVCHVPAATAQQDAQRHVLYRFRPTRLPCGIWIRMPRPDCRARGKASQRWAGSHLKEGNCVGRNALDGPSRSQLVALRPSHELPRAIASNLT